MTQLLVVSYYFPPFGGGAVARIHGFVKYLPRFGVRPVVLTVKPTYYESHFLDESLAGEYSGEVEIARTPSFEPGGRQVKNMVFGAAETTPLQRVKLAAMQMIQRHLLIPDRCILWRRHALKAGRKILAERKPDAVLASTPPATNIGVGWALAKAAAVPLIVDYRDLWTNNPFFQPATRLRARWERRLERRWVGAARAVLGTTEEMVDRIRGLYPLLEKRVHYLPNGFDPDRHHASIRTRAKGEPVRFTHTGALTVNRSPAFFLQAVAKAVERAPQLRDKIDIRFYGFLAEQHRREIERLGLGGLARDMGFVSSAEASRVLREETDVALVFQRRADGGETAIPGKLYEYLAAGCEILAMCDPGATTNLLGKLGSGVITPFEDIERIVAAIVEIVDRVAKNPTAHVLPASKLATFDRREIARDLARIVRHAAERRGGNQGHP